MAKLVLVKINNVDVTSKILEYKIEQSYKEIVNNIYLYLAKSVDSLLTIEPYQNITIWESFSAPVEQNANKVFSGFVAKKNSSVFRYEILSYDKLWAGVRKQVTKSYDKDIDASAGIISEIFKDLVVTYAGLNADAVSIQDSGTTYLLSKFLCRNTDVFERMQTLAEILDWQFYYRADTDKVYFEPKGYLINSNIIYIGGTSNNVQNKVKWTEDISNLANVIIVRGNIFLSSQTELFNGDASQTDFTINYEPESVRVFISGVEKKGGVEGSTTTFDYTIDKQNKEIRFKVAPAVGTNNVKIEYFWGAPTPVETKDDISVSVYGESEKTLNFTDIMTVNDAEQRALNYLANFSQPLLFTTAKITPDNVNALGLKVGQIIRVIDAEQGIDENLVVNKLKSSYPSRDIEVGLGDRTWEVGMFEEDVVKRLKRLEEEMMQSSDFLIHIRQFDHSGTPLQQIRKSVEIQTRAINDSWIWGHPNTIWGTTEWGDRRGTATQVYFKDYTT